MTQRSILRRAVLAGSLLAATASATTGVQKWSTNADHTQGLKHGSVPFTKRPRSSLPTIRVDRRRSFQSVEGFGYAITGGSAQVIMEMSPSARRALLTEIFGRRANDLKVRSIRISIGSSDLNDHVFSYDDLPPGQVDPDLKQFSIAEDRKALIPLLREILAIDPRIHILASPWSPPTWMKTNGLPKAGSLKPEYYPAYAKYLVRYLREMKAEGIPVESITVQNEPLYLKNTPSMSMTAAEQAEFIGKHVGPALRAAGLNTRILAYDHNPNRPDYPLAVLADPEAAKFLHGTAFHLYEGDPAAMSKVHDAHPDKPIYITEQMVTDIAWETNLPASTGSTVARFMIAALRNWNEGIILWNLAADPKFGPHTDDGGCVICQGAVTIDRDKVMRNAGYYTLAQVSRFVTPGSRRIESTEPDRDLPNVAWRRPDGRAVLVVANLARAKKSFAVSANGRTFESTLPAGSAATYVW